MRLQYMLELVKVLCVPSLNNIQIKLNILTKYMATETDENFNSQYHFWSHTPPTWGNSKHLASNVALHSQPVNWRANMFQT